MSYTYDEKIFSDLYKDANGFRPKNHEFYSASPERKQVIWDNTLEDLDSEMAMMRKREKMAIEDFEALIGRTIESGAIDRENALHWLRTAEDDDYMKFDDGYFEYSYGLPYGYLKEKF